MGCSSAQTLLNGHGEDGVLIEIFRRIGDGGRCFVEVGIGDGIENNTVFLEYNTIGHVIIWLPILLFAIEKIHRSQKTSDCETKSAGLAFQ